ncbi:class I SAM-dependent methyltransferase [Murimonas intestini]|uniref:class I SAM-dependent methyltransferase n=1 Tax=Murimonas intestini TaxID=1337051 RepID=UPI0011DDB2FC|nr:class I SAM-dependent methyltransferase [Murimonas intestini]
MYKKILEYARRFPELYEPSSAPFWDDVHISKSMLDAHLDPDFDGASRNMAFMKASAEWICSICSPVRGKKLLDLGCGPGIYDKMFCEAGFEVTGIDISRRSIQYAAGQAKQDGMDIEYICKNYLEMDYQGIYDVATLIYCDFGVLSPKDRRSLLIKIKRALKPGGILILDGFTQEQLKGYKEGSTVEYLDGGFWKDAPYICIQRNRLYPDTRNYLEQYIIISEDDCQCYNNWNQIFSRESFDMELRQAGFEDMEYFGDVAGEKCLEGSETICAVARLQRHS